MSDKAGKKAAPLKGADPALLKETAAAKVTIDFDAIGNRILALPIPPRNYLSLDAGKEGIIFLQEGPLVVGRFFIGESAGALHRFDLTQRKTEKILDNVRKLVLSADGEKMLINQEGRWVIAPTNGPIEQGRKILQTGDMTVYVEPLVEWKQMYHEAWRIERDFFYAPNYHGLNLKEAEKKYAPYLDGITSRADLNYLFEEMLGELSCGHVYISGGDRPEVESVPGGLLGADYKIENGRYRFARVYSGENWNPELRAPLTQPGVSVTAGEYLLSVNGRELHASDEIYKLFEATAGKSATLRIGPNPDGTGSREVVVIPVGDEIGLRKQAWIEGNRRKVVEMSGGRLAYVYLSNTSGLGFNDFNRYYFTQVGKEGAVIDERYNGGGLIADYIIDYLRRPLMGHFASREGGDYLIPSGGIFGAESHDHQRVRRFRRRCYALAVPGRGDRAPGRETHLGRAGRHGGCGDVDGRWAEQFAAERILESQRDMGRRELRRRSRYRSRNGPGGRPRRPGSPTRKDRPDSFGGIGKKSSAQTQEARLSGLPLETLEAELTVPMKDSVFLSRISE